MNTTSIGIQLSAILIFLVFTQSSLAQSIWTNPITGTNPNTSNPYITGQTVNTNISVSGIGRGTGISGTNANDRYNANGWNSGSLDANDYFTFTLAPNSGCEFDLISFIYTSQASGTGPSSFAFRSSIDGFVANIGVATGTGTTIDLSAANFQNITTTIEFRLYAWGASSSTGTFSVNSFTFNGTTICGGGANTITTGAVSGAPFTVTCSSTDNGTVIFTSTGTFTAGNTYTAELSDASGSFSSPSVIGTLNSIANSGTINIIIPSQTSSGTGYRIRVISSSPSAVGSNSSTFNISLTGGPCPTIPPHITSIIYDGCAGGSCSNEGQSEIVFANSGSYNILVNGSNLNLDYTIGTPYDLIGTVVNMSATTTAMNTAAGCSGTYVNGFGSTIPPNSSILLVPSDICTAVFSWDALCGQGPIYVIYGQSGTSGDTWRTGGNFGNTSGSKTFDLQITATNGTTYSTSYSYNAPSSGTNGNYATYSSDPPGGASVTQGNFPNCQITTTVLASDLIFFSGYEFNRRNQLIWKTSSEQNNSHFTISRSVDGINYDVVTTISGAGTTDLPQEYQWEDVENNTGVNYYKLRSFDFDGTMHEKGIVSIKSMQDIPYFNSITSTIELPTKSDISIYDLGGQLIINSFYEKSIAFDQHGLFLLHDNNSGETFRLFIQQ